MNENYSGEGSVNLRINRGIRIALDAVRRDNIRRPGGSEMIDLKIKLLYKQCFI